MSKWWKEEPVIFFLGQDVREGDAEKKGWEEGGKKRW